MIGKGRRAGPSSMNERLVIHLEQLESDRLLSLLREGCGVANGCFDVLHSGHLSLLSHFHAECDRRGLRAVVAMNSDRSVRGLKGHMRPIVPQESRAELIVSLRWPFNVVVFNEESPQRLMDLLRPAIVVKGAEYDSDTVVRWSGSEVVTVPMFLGWSTTGILEGGVEEGPSRR